MSITRTPLLAPLVLTLAFPVATLLGDSTTGNGMRIIQIGYLISTLAWLGAIWIGQRSEAKLPSVTVVLVIALLARLLLLPAEVSDDVYRYVWEGLIRLHGFSPYTTAPVDAELAHLRNNWWHLINHPNHSGIYPPTAQLVFTVWAWIWASPVAFKCALVLVELGVLWALVGWLRRAEQATAWVLVYALCPAVLNATAREGHLDVLMLLGLVAMGWASAGQPRLLDAFCFGCGLGLAAGTKWIALLLVPWLLFWLGRQRRVFLAGGNAVLGVGLTLVVPGLFYLQDGVLSWFLPLLNFAENFHSLDYLRQTLLPYLGPHSLRGLSVVTLLLVSLLTLRRSLGKVQVWLFGALLLLSPTLHPWYVTWLLPGLCFVRRSGWLVLPLTLTVAFEGDFNRAAHGAWYQPDWVGPAVHLPLYAALVVFVFVNRRPLGNRDESATLSA